MFEVVHDHRRMLLHLEFKLYALRHPQRKRRLADLHAAMCVAEPGEEWARIFPEIGGRDEPTQRRQGAQLSAVMDGLGLGLMFVRDALTDDALRRQIRAVVEIVMQEKEPAVS